MKKKHSSMVTLGITSLFLIFAVLCMVILSLLTLGSSRSDLRMSRRSMEQTTAYYDACTEATDLCLAAEEYLQTAYEESASKQEYLKKAGGLTQQGFLWNEESLALSFQIPFSDTQTLYVEAKIHYPETADGTFLELCTWQTQSAGTWNPDMKQPVYTKEITQ